MRIANPYINKRRISDPPQRVSDPPRRRCSLKHRHLPSAIINVFFALPCLLFIVQQFQFLVRKRKTLTLTVSKFCGFLVSRRKRWYCRKTFSPALQLSGECHNALWAEIKQIIFKLFKMLISFALLFYHHYPVLWR